jgi:two-component system phosphate regulon response regulator PhoB
MNASVLVVEDDAALCDLLSWNLSAEGYEVRSTGDGEEALVMVRVPMPSSWTG